MTHELTEVLDSRSAPIAVTRPKQAIYGSAETQGLRITVGSFCKHAHIQTSKTKSNKNCGTPKLYQLWLWFNNTLDWVTARVATS